MQYEWFRYDWVKIKTKDVILIIKKALAQKKEVKFTD